MDGQSTRTLRKWPLCGGGAVLASVPGGRIDSGGGSGDRAERNDWVTSGLHYLLLAPAYTAELASFTCARWSFDEWSQEGTR